MRKPSEGEQATRVPRRAKSEVSAQQILEESPISAIIGDSSKPRETGKLYQDQIYGAKVLDPLAVAIMDCPEFERLSGLKQLGFADRVYRSAKHTRLEHSVGTYFISRTIMRRIAQNHERLGLEHPGKDVAGEFRVVPSNSEVDDGYTSHQAKWRGVMEVVSAAALLHDLGHVPFAHTLEDEFTGIYRKHDRVGGPRLYQMLFNGSSDLASVFSNKNAEWLDGIANDELQKLIYVILSWKENIQNRWGFADVLQDLKRQPSAERDGDVARRLGELEEWHASFCARGMFHPFMSDIIGNTICSDILDYLPRDCTNLGMDVRRHDRLQRYFTIRRGSLYPTEGLRMSIMVTRKGHGGQRRDVTSAVLEIMRQRFEMAERVYYHHKKASASSMLAKLAELAAKSEVKPRDDEEIYPAPWSESSEDDVETVPHLAHLTDDGMIDYLGKVRLIKEGPEGQSLQRRLHRALVHRRHEMYQTLLVIDADLIDKARALTLVRAWRGDPKAPSNARRVELERKLAAAADAKVGEVIIYCPDSDMQSKEVDVRLEIDEGKVYPLREQATFAYNEDVKTLNDHYKEMWRSYIFVSLGIFRDPGKCKKVVDRFCAEYDVPHSVAYRKVRTHEFTETGAGFNGLSETAEFLEHLPFTDLPAKYSSILIKSAVVDPIFQHQVLAGSDPVERLSSLLDISIIDLALKTESELSPAQVVAMEQYREHLQQGGKPRPMEYRGPAKTFESYRVSVIEVASNVDT